MNTIIRGTTPTVQFSFSAVKTSEIDVAYMIIKCDGRVIIEKDLSEASEITHNHLQWKLTQEESIKLKVGATVSIYCDWKTNDGTRGRSKVGTYVVEESGKCGVI